MNDQDFICLYCGDVCDPTGVWEDALVQVQCRHCESKQWKPFTFNNQYITSEWGKQAREQVIRRQLESPEVHPYKDLIEDESKWPKP